MNAFMGDGEGGRRGESTSAGLGFEDSGAFTPKFGTPERGDLAARVSGREAAEDDGLRFQRAGTSAATVMRAMTPTIGKYDAEVAEKKCQEAAEFVAQARRIIATARANLRAGVKAEVGDDEAYATPKSSKIRKSLPQTPGTGEREQKGLRHFSMRVCEKVEEKKHTSYNEVANELVEELRVTAEETNADFDEKNVRRRVYDALNVLMALEIIRKKKKEIFWNGYPEGYVKPGESPPPAKAAGPRTSNRELASTESIDAFEQKTNYLAELVEQHDALVALVERNQKALAGDGPPPTGIQLPFILIQTKSEAEIDVEISDDQRTVHFDFNRTPFQIHDGFHVLTKMINLHKKRVVGDDGGAEAKASTSKTPTTQKATPVKRKTPTPSKGVGKSPLSAKKAKK